MIGAEQTESQSYLSIEIVYWVMIVAHGYASISSFKHHCNSVYFNSFTETL